MGREGRGGFSDGIPLSRTPAFFSFGMFIIDEIEYFTLPTTTNQSSQSTGSNTPEPKPRHTSLPGGAGLYALLGARLLSPPPFSRHLAWILDAGSDLPPSSSLLSQIRAWATSTQFRRDDTRLTTRAWNGYGSTTDPDYRAFHYLTPKLRLDVPDLTPDQLTCRSWHMVCSSRRCEDILQQIQGRRQKESSRGGGSTRGVVVWEPIPDECSPEELERLQRALKAGDGGVQVVSPNAEELGRFFDEPTREKGQDEMVALLMGWNEQNRHPQDHVRDGDCVCVIREGKFGSSIYLPPNHGDAVTNSTSGRPATTPSKIHLPAYHDSSMASQVLDPTGGGNTYLGAYALALGYLSDITLDQNPNIDLQKQTQRSEIPDPVRTALDFAISVLNSTELKMGQFAAIATKHLAAGICACVAAGYAIEQTGVPRLSEADETWNGELVGERIELYLDRVGDEIKNSVALNRD